MASNTIGNNIEKTQEATNKLNDIKQKIDKVNSFVAIGTALGGKDGLTPIKTIIENNIDGTLFEVTQDLKRQAKGYAIQRVKEELPTEDELEELILNKGCEIQVINVVKNSKKVISSMLNKGKNTLEGIIKKLEKLKKKTENSLESLVQISALLIIFQTLITALKAIIIAARLALVAFTGIFASGAAEERIITAIKNAEGKVRIYVGAIQQYTGYLQKVITIIITIFNFIPLIINIFKILLGQVNNFINLLEDYYKKYIIKCIPGGYDTNSDTINDNIIENFINTNIDNSNNLIPDVLGEYIHDDSLPEHRIYRPKIN